MTVRNWIRIVTLVGAYLLLRPYLLNLGKRLQGKQHEKSIPVPDSKPKTKGQKKVKFSPNELRGQVEKQIKEDSDSEGEAEASGPAWGKKARRRQRMDVRKILEVEEKRLLAEEGDEEIKDLLVDYDEDDWASAGKA